MKTSSKTLAKNFKMGKTSNQNFGHFGQNLIKTSGKNSIKSAKLWQKNFNQNFRQKFQNQNFEQNFGQKFDQNFNQKV